MSDVSCPRCGDSFRLPSADIPPGASARCPWCGETLPVAQLLSRLPPVAEVFAADGESMAATAADLQLEDAGAELDEYSEPAADGQFDFTDQPADNSFETHDPAFLEASQLEFGEAAEPRPLSEVSDMTFGRDNQRPTTRGRAKKKTSSIRSILGIAVGGLMAFPLAAIILALLGKPLDLGFWPFDGQTIATGTSARTAAPLTTGGSQPSPQQPVSRQQDRSLADNPPHAADGSGVIQADHDSLYPSPTESAAIDGSRDADDTLFVDAGEPDWRGSLLQIPGGRATGPEWVEPLAVDEDTEESEQPLSTDAQQFEPQQPEPEPSEPLEPAPSAQDPLESDADALDQMIMEEPATEQPASETNPLPTANLETPEPEPFQSETPELQIPELEMPAADDETAASQPDDPPSIQAATVAEPEATAAEPNETPAEPELTVTQPTETPAEPETAAVAEVEVPATVDQPLAADEVASQSPLTPPQEVSPLLQSLLEAADESLAAVRDYDHAEGAAGLKRRLATLYADVAAVGEAAEQQDEAVVSDLIDRLKMSDLIKDLAPAAPNWLKYSKRPNNGMLAVGILRQENDKWFVDWSGAVPLEIRSLGAASPEAGAQVLVLGRIVNADPSSPALEPLHIEPLN